MGKVKSNSRCITPLNRWKLFIHSINYCWKYFCETTSFHGIVFLYGNHTNKCQKLVWLSVVAISITMLSTFIYYLWLHYMGNATRTIVKSHHLPQALIPFPAVTICPAAKIDFNKVDYVLSTSSKLMMERNISARIFYRTVNQIVTPSGERDPTYKDLEDFEQILHGSRMNLSGFLDFVSIDCGSLFSKCLWNQKEIPCKKILMKILTFDGSCCSFNFQGIRLISYDSIYANGFGLFSGLNLILRPQKVFKKLEPVDENYVIYIHDPFTYPTTESYNMFVSERKETSFAIDVIYSMSGPNLRELYPAERKCVFRDEWRLKYFRAFTYENCITECRLQRYIELCGCIPPFLYFEGSKATICQPKMFQCLIQNYDQIWHPEKRENFLSLCNCPLECDILIIETKINEWDFNHSNFTVNNFYDGIAMNESIIHIYFRKSYSLLYNKVLSLQTINFVSNIGGLISLFLGCSFISILEIIYIFVRRFSTFYKEMKEDSNHLFITPQYFKFHESNRNQRNVFN